ncbi:hypothetical protein [Pedobacter immunditicola]|uniref:hypothetical protein n=1 Tax=Pedobacter immunditicola TaxID=3133440 RepID=UPI00309B64F3
MWYRVMLFIGLFHCSSPENCFSQEKANAQALNPKSITLSLSENELLLEDRTIQTLTLKIVNTGDQVFKGMLNISNTEFIELLSRSEYPMELKAGESKFIPIRLLPGKNMAVAEPYHLRATLNKGTEVYATTVCEIKMTAKKSVALISMTSSLILSAIGDSIKIPVKIANTGNTAQQINLVCQLPQDMQNRGFHTTLKFSIKPYTDTLIYINKSVTREMLRMDSFTINLFGIYENGDIFGQNYIQVQTLKNRRINDSNLPDYHYQDNLENSFTMMTQNIGHDYASYQLYGGGSVETPYGRLGINADATLWKNAATPYLRNSYVSYEGYHMGFTAGNMSRNLEANVNGRGFSAFYVDTATKHNYEIGMVDRSSNLIDPFNFFGSSGKAMWARFKRHQKKLVYMSTFLYEADAYTRANNLISANEFSLLNRKNIRIFAELNAGHTRDQKDATNQKIGYLGTFNTDGKLGRFTFNSNNTFSSSYYPGLRRGLLTFNERINYTSGIFGLWGSYNYFKNKPEYLSSLNFSNEFGTTRAEIGASTAFNKLFVSLSPLYHAENSSYSFFQNGRQEGSLRSLRISSNLNYANSLANLYLFFNVESGASSSSFTGGYQKQLKVSGNLKWGMFRINGSYQDGLFYVSEAFNNQLTHQKKNKVTNLSATLTRRFFNNKAEIEAGASYLDHSNTGNSLMLTGSAAYQLNKRTKFFSSLFRTEYKYMNYSFNNLQLGLTRDFSAAKLGSKNKTLTVAIYKDNNQNGIYDEGDLPATDQIVYIDHVAFLTTKEGKITYKNLQPGNYSISMSGNHNWYAPAQSVVMTQADLKLEIPLRKIGMIAGKIEYSFNQYSYDVAKVKMGLKVMATDEHGKTTITKTNELGGFSFYLPDGQYTITMEDLPQQVVCTNTNTKVWVTNKIVQPLVMTLKIKERRTEVKKFISPNLNR